jgi:hypothetical protein
LIWGGGTGGWSRWEVTGREPGGKNEEGRKQEKVKRKEGKYLWLERKGLAARPEEVFTIPHHILTSLPKPRGGKEPGGPGAVPKALLSQDIC